jgi:hypothetical protein
MGTTEKLVPVIIKVNPKKNLILYRTTPHIDECKCLIMEVLKQAIRDFYNLADSNITEDINIYNEAVEFLFEEGYTIDWGGANYTLDDLLDILDLDIKWFRERILAGRIRSRKQIAGEINGKL